MNSTRSMTELRSLPLPLSLSLSCVRVCMHVFARRLPRSAETYSHLLLCVWARLEAVRRSGGLGHHQIHRGRAIDCARRCCRQFVMGENIGSARMREKGNQTNHKKKRKKGRERKEERTELEATRKKKKKGRRITCSLIRCMMH